MAISEEQLKQAKKLVNEIIKFTRNTLLVKLRFLDAALHQLMPQSCDVAGFSVDGEHLYYNIKNVLFAYKTEAQMMPRIYLHCLMHCIFRHMFVGSSINKQVWDLACDIAVENAINDLNLDFVKTKNSSEQTSKLLSLKKEIKQLTAEKIYRFYLDKNLSFEQIEATRKLFYIDDHHIWYMPPEEKLTLYYGADSHNIADGNNAVPIVFASADALSDEWKKISERMQIDIETMSKLPGTEAGSLMQELRAVNREKYDYSEFLKKFAVLGEEMQINDNEFDYVFYTYGLKLYKNMPLIEPLEYKEVKKIKEFVIAVDTSGSTSGELVQKFLNKTYNILKQQESFFTKINLHIIQCDADIQESAKITNQEEFDSYLENMKIKGLGGTDFRPVFDYVDKLIENKEFANLKGMIYFTDGWGAFPEHQPCYDTAFIFVDDDYNNYAVPVWAIKLVLQKDEI